MILQKLILYFFNKSEKDVIMMEELEFLIGTPRLKITFSVSQISEGSTWKGEVGRISPELISKYLPLPSVNPLVLVCGPPSFNETAKEILEKMGYSKDLSHIFL